MTLGTQIAFGVMLIASGSAGYERYMHEGRTGRAVVDIFVVVAGALLLGSGIDRFAA